MQPVVARFQVKVQNLKDGESTASKGEAWFNLSTTLNTSRQATLRFQLMRCCSHGPPASSQGAGVHATPIWLYLHAWKF